MRCDEGETYLGEGRPPQKTLLEMIDDLNPTLPPSQKIDQIQRSIHVVVQENCSPHRRQIGGLGGWRDLGIILSVGDFLGTRDTDHGGPAPLKRVPHQTMGW